MTLCERKRGPWSFCALFLGSALIGMLVLSGMIGTGQVAAQSVIDPDLDSDGDGIMNSHDPDDDNDGITDDIDIAPFDPSLPGVAPTPNTIDPDADSDGDGIENSHDPDEDNDGDPDQSDPDPFSPVDPTVVVTPQPVVTQPPAAENGGHSDVTSPSGSESQSRSEVSLVRTLPNTGSGPASGTGWWGGILLLVSAASGSWLLVRGRHRMW